MDAVVVVDNSIFLRRFNDDDARDVLDTDI